MFEYSCVSFGPQFPSDEKGEGGDGLPVGCRVIRQQEPPFMEGESWPSVWLQMWRPNHSMMKFQTLRVSQEWVSTCVTNYAVWLQKGISRNFATLFLPNDPPSMSGFDLQKNLVFGGPQAFQIFFYMGETIVPINCIV